MIEATQLESLTRTDVAASVAAVARELRLDLAGMTVALIESADGPTLQVAGTMSKFVVAADEFVVASGERNVDLRITTGWCDLAIAERGRLLFDSGSIWRLYVDETGGYQFRLAAPYSNWQPYIIANFDAQFTTGEILFAPAYFDRATPLYPLEYPLDELLFINLLATGKGLEVHACGLVDANGSGYLFAGQSGAGKTTTAHLWQGCEGVRLLSDERVILRAGAEGRIWMYGTPWHGEGRIAEPTGAPLDRIFLLARGRANELQRQTQVEAAARLLSCSFPTFYNPQGLDYTLQLLDDIAHRVPCDELRFVPDEKVIDFIVGAGLVPARIGRKTDEPING